MFVLSSDIMARKPTDTVQLNLRFPESLRRDLARGAARNKHSLNAEIVRRLRRSIADEALDEMAKSFAESSEVKAMLVTEAKGLLEYLVQRIEQIRLRQEAKAPRAEARSAEGSKGRALSYRVPRADKPEEESK
jgi:Arc-like DNA binding domain